MTAILSSGFKNPISYFKLKNFIKSDIQKSLNPYWRIRTIGSITRQNRNLVSVFVEVESEWGWTNDFIRFTKINGEWVGDYKMIKLSQGIYDGDYERRNGVDLILMKLEDDRDTKLKEIGI